MEDEIIMAMRLLGVNKIEQITPGMVECLSEVWKWGIMRFRAVTPEKTKPRPVLNFVTGYNIQYMMLQASPRDN
jgi:hypothetical protein